MNKSIITVVKADDWQGLYFNGEIIEQDHVITLDMIVDLVNAAQECDRKMLVFDYKECWCDLEWIENLGEFPNKLSDVKME